MRFYRRLFSFCFVVILSAIALAQEPQTLGAIGVPDNDGIRLTEIMSNGPAEMAGLAVGDVLTAIDGNPLKKISEKTELMTSKKLGSRLIVTYVRENRVAETTLTVGAAPPIEVLPPVKQEKAVHSARGKRVTIEFAKSANLAFVSIQHSANRGTTPDAVVAVAINAADAAAISKSEREVMTDITLLSVERPLALNLLDLSEMDTDQWRSAMGDLQRIDTCVAGWRLALRKLSADEPKECEVILEPVPSAARQ